MSLRNRIVFTLLAITTILLVPALYGLWSLRNLSAIADTLKTRNAEASLAFGRLHTSLAEMERAQQVYSALASQSIDVTAGQRATAQESRQQVVVWQRRIQTELDSLQRKGFTSVTSGAMTRWTELQDALARHSSLIERREIDAATEFRRTVVDPAFEEMDRSLDPISRAIDESGQQQVDRAQAVARLGATGTLVALAAALMLTLAIGTLLTRTLLRPIQELRRGMAHVAEGDFEPRVQIPRQRPDELGDLARSFDTMTAQLAELDRLKAEFVSVASHEIKTPLSVIRGYVSLLLDGIYGQVTETQRKTLTSVADQTERLNRLVHRLLDVTRFEAGGGRLELREIPLRGFLADLTKGFEVLAYQNEIGFHVGLDQRLPEFIVGDPERLNEVLGNLLSNAFKFTPKGGRIEVRAQPQGGGVVVEVEDTGVGIPADQLPKIFEKFFQVDNEAQPRSAGSGLGLAIAREIVEAHGGTISAESEVGRGTRFRVTVPARPPASAPAAHS